jgi:hypothetical protein
VAVGVTRHDTTRHAQRACEEAEARRRRRRRGGLRTSLMTPIAVGRGRGSKATSRVRWGRFVMVQGRGCDLSACAAGWAVCHAQLARARVRTRRSPVVVPGFLVLLLRA